ncbi:hypothetical protein EPI10_015727 [Gossypium australe]|uniref:Uncharacterized protein n=1 Tax=Gossypium australe TaxID=47621 RepID=A0A5B6VLX9_9ROSI|nr:hypothetical protein EPI10_015727 [Gossypium australe]
MSSPWDSTLHSIGDFLQWFQCTYKNGGVHEVEAFTSLATQVSSMSSMLKNFTTNDFNGNLISQQTSQFENISCVYYGDNHMFKNYLSNPEAIYYMGNQSQNRSSLGPQSNFYNTSWRNHLNSSLSNQGAGPIHSYMQSRPNQLTGFS